MKRASLTKWGVSLWKVAHELTDDERAFIAARAALLGRPENCRGDHRWWTNRDGTLDRRMKSPLSPWCGTSYVIRCAS